MKKASLLAVGILSTGVIGSTRAATFDLFEYAFNIDGTVSDIGSDPVPGGVNVGAFDAMTGLGTIQFSISGSGSHYFSTFYDHEIDQSINTFFNEVGATSGSPSAGQSWELGDPFFSDIFSHFQNSALVNQNNSTSANDVSMAMGWDFTLGAFDTAKITLLTSDTAPTSGFYLEQNDPDSLASVYLSGSLSIISRQPSGVPENGSSVALLALGLTGLFTAHRALKRTPVAKI